MNAPPSDFESHESAFTTTHSALMQSLSKPSGSSQFDPSAQQAQLAALRSSLSAMEALAGNTSDSDENSHRQQVIADARETLQSLETKVSAHAAQQLDTSIQSAIGSGDCQIEPVSEEESSVKSYERRLQATAASLENQRTGWKKAKEQMHQTESVSEEILNNLSRQRETVLLASAVADDSHRELGRGGRLIGKMRRKLRQNKMYVWAIIITLGFLILLTLYMRMTHSRPHSGNHTAPITITEVDTPLEVEVFESTPDTFAAGV